VDRAIPISFTDTALHSDDAPSAEGLALAESLARGSGEPDAVLQAARIFALEGRRERAIELLRQATLAHPRHPEILELLADLLSRGGTFEEADLSFRLAVESAPDRAETWYRRGLHHARQGQSPAAREAYEKATGLDPSHVKGWVNLGLVLAELGDRDAAIVALERAVRVDPRCAEAHSNLGVLYAESGLRAESIAEFRRAIALGPDC